MIAKEQRRPEGRASGRAHDFTNRINSTTASLVSHGRLRVDLEAPLRPRIPDPAALQRIHARAAGGVLVRTLVAAYGRDAVEAAIGTWRLHLSDAACRRKS